MSKDNIKDKDPMHYLNLIRSFEEIQAKLKDESLTFEERITYMEEMNSIWEEIKRLNPNEHPQMNYLKIMGMKLIAERSKKEGDDIRKTKAKMYMGMQFFDEILREAQIMMKKEENDFFEKYPELLPPDTDEKVEDFDPRWKKFRDYYLQKLNDELRKNKYVERGMEKWKRLAMVQYAFNKFNEIYRREEDLLDKEEEVKKSYKKFPKNFKKFLKILPKR